MSAQNANGPCGALRADALRSTGPAHGKDHPHFVCIDCSEVACLPDVRVRVEAAPKRKPKKMGEVLEVFLRDRCLACA